MTVEQNEKSNWGRVLLTGGTSWASNGRKDRPPAKDADLIDPRILRSMYNIRVTKIISGPAANYAIAIDVFGCAYLFGKSPSSAFGEVISENKPMKITCFSLGMPKGTKWVTGAAARGHVLLVDELGGVWGCGNNTTGQLGLHPCNEVERFTRITGPWSRESAAKIVQVSAGHTFSLFLTDTGQIYAAGSSEAGQLGNGKTGERLLKVGKIAFDMEVPPRLVQGLNGKKMTQIASGNQHSIAMDDEGYLWAWGFAGYSRLGLQDQKDRLVPTMVPQFAGSNVSTRAAQVICGPTNSVVVDRLGMFHMAGKWKLTGDGSTGQPYTSFKTIQDIMSCKTIKASCGGCTHFLTTPSDIPGIPMTVGFGQGVLYGELGLGPEGGKSATKPVQIMPLEGVDVIDIAAGAFTTYFLARPNEASQNLLRHPANISSKSYCTECKEAERDSGGPLECEKCENGVHIECLDPPLEAVPDGEWFCADCEKEGNMPPDEDEEAPKLPLGGSEGKKKGTPAKNGSGKRKAVDEASKVGSGKRRR